MNVVPSTPLAYIPTTAPYRHQAEALSLLMKHPVFAILAEMGTGKSKMICDEWGWRATTSPIRNLLILAPKGSYRNWYDLDNGEFVKHMPRAFVDNAIIVPWKSGSAPALKAVEMMIYNVSKPRAFVVNVEALSSVAKCREYIEKFLRSGPAMFVVDESTTIRTPTAQRTKHVLKLAALASIRRIMSGLIAPNSPLDLWAQYYFLDWQILRQRSYYTFRNRYAIMGNVYLGTRTVQQVIGYRNEDELHELIKPFSYRVLKKDCLDLPEKIYQICYVQLTKQQERMYNEMRLKATTEIAANHYMSAPDIIARLRRLHQIVAGYAVDEQGDPIGLDESRIEAVLDLLDDHAGKAVIWVQYHYIIRKLVAALKKHFGDDTIVAEYHGANVATRDAEVERWKSSGPGAARFLVATQQAGGLGNNWTEANLVIYHSNDFNLELRMQSEDRCHRIGQRESVTYVDMVAENTIDVKIINALRNKINISSIIMGDGWKKWLI